MSNNHPSLEANLLAMKKHCLDLKSEIVFYQNSLKEEKDRVVALLLDIKKIEESFNKERQVYKEKINELENHIDFLTEELLILNDK